MTNKEWIMFLLIGVAIVGISSENDTLQRVDSDFRPKANSQYQVKSNNDYRFDNNGNTLGEHISPPPANPSLPSKKGRPSAPANNSNKDIAYHVNENYVPDTVSVYSILPGASVKFITRCREQYSHHHLLGSQSSYTIPWDIHDCTIISSSGPVGITY